jgi:hypothetical protein
VADVVELVVAGRAQDVVYLGGDVVSSYFVPATTPETSIR